MILQISRRFYESSKQLVFIFFEIMYILEISSFII